MMALSQLFPSRWQDDDQDDGCHLLIFHGLTIGWPDTQDDARMTRLTEKQQKGSVSTCFLSMSEI